MTRTTRRPARVFPTLGFVQLVVTGEVWEWRGPAPFYFVSVPPDACELLHETAAAVTYGWGMIPVALRVGDTATTTSLWPKDGGYVIPLKAVVRRGAGIEVGDVVTVELTVDV